MAQYDLNLRDYLRILRRRKGIVILVPLLFGAFSFGFTLVQAPTPRYRATAVVRIEQALPLASLLLQELVTLSPVGNLETHAALVKGFPVMSLAAKKLALIPADATPEKIRATPAYLRAIQQLQGMVEVKPVEGASLIEISVTSSSPEEAVRVANGLAEAFQEDNFATRSRQVREAREFIERQLQEVGARLRQSEDELKAFKERNQVVLLPEEIREVLSRLAALEVDQSATRRAIAETQEQLRRLEEGKLMSRPVGISPDGADPALSKLSASLSDLMLERENLLLTLLPAHPQVKQLDAQIANVRQSLKEALTSRLQALRARADELQRTVARRRQEQAAIPETSLDLARMDREVKISERLFSLLKEKHQEALIREKEQVAEVSLVRPAVGPLRPINPPQPLPKAAVGLVIGLAVGLVLAFVVETLDTSIGAIDEVESLLETPVLGVIPHLDVKAELSEERGEDVVLDKETEDKYRFLISLFLPKSRVAEALRALRTNLLFSGLERDIKTVLVTSSTQMEGKTTVAINLAITLAQLGKRTLLVEADLRNPFIHHAFGIPKEPGFTEVAIGSANLDEATRSFVDLILGKVGVEGLTEQRGLDNLFILPSGHQPPDPAEFLSAQGVASFLADIRQRYDYVVIDSAPVLPVADTSVLGSRVDGALFVIQVGQVARAALRRAKSLLGAAKARVLGVCLTRVRAEVSPDYAEMAYYQYRYGAREQRATPAAGGLGFLTFGRKGKLVLGGLLVLLLLALAVGIWAWRLGGFKLPVLSASLVNSGASVPLKPAPQVVDVRPRAEEPKPAPDPKGSAGVHAPSGPHYAVQLHAFRTEAEARRAAARYRARGLPVSLAEASAPGTGRGWRVLAGEFATQEEAEALGWDLVLGGEIEDFLIVDKSSGS